MSANQFGFVERGRHLTGWLEESQAGQKCRAAVPRWRAESPSSPMDDGCRHDELRMSRRVTDHPIVPNHSLTGPAGSRAVVCGTGDRDGGLDRRERIVGLFGVPTVRNRSTACRSSPSRVSVRLGTGRVGTGRGGRGGRGRKGIGSTRGVAAILGTSLVLVRHAEKGRCGARRGKWK